MWGRMCSSLYSGSLSSLTHEGRNSHTPLPPPPSSCTRGDSPASLTVSALTFRRPRSLKIRLRLTCSLTSDRTLCSWKETLQNLQEVSWRNRKGKQKKSIHNSDFSHYSCTWAGKFYFSSRDIVQCKKSQTISTMTQLTLKIHHLHFFSASLLPCLCTTARFPQKKSGKSFEGSGRLYTGYLLPDPIRLQWG